jgi:uncharacterized protein YndB with AHSA1/START domain
MAAAPWTFEYSVLVPAAPPQVFAALTLPAQLQQWFAEHVDVDLAAGRYRFWGRCTYGAPTESQAQQRLLHADPLRSLSFEWYFAGIESRVEIGLAPTENAATTRLQLRHVLSTLPTLERPRELIEDLWRMSLGNLAALLRGAGVVLPKFTNPRPEIRLAIVIDAPRASVFKALTEPDRLDQWIASAAAVEPRAGGRYSYGWSYPIGDATVAGGPTRVLQWVPNEKLVTDWPDWRGDATQAPTAVTWLLADRDGHTLLTLVHSGFGRTADLCDYPQGWWNFLVKLSSFVTQSAATS